MCYKNLPKVKTFSLDILKTEMEMFTGIHAKPFEGCLIHPTRVDSSLAFVIRQTGNRFVNPIPSNWHELFPLLSIRHAGSWFARDLENIVDLDFEGGLKMLSICVDSIESTRIVRIDWSLWPRFKNEEGSCIITSRILTSGGLYTVGWKCCRFDRTDTNRFSCCRFIMPEVDLHVSLFHGSWLLVGYTGWVENVVNSSRFDWIDTNCFSCCRFVMPEVDLQDATQVEM